MAALIGLGQTGERQAASASRLWSDARAIYEGRDPPAGRPPVRRSDDGGRRVPWTIAGHGPDGSPDEAGWRESVAHSYLKAQPPPRDSRGTPFEPRNPRKYPDFAVDQMLDVQSEIVGSAARLDSRRVLREISSLKLREG